MKEKRKSKRIEIKLSVDIEGKGIFETKDISKDGMFILLKKGAQYNVGKYQKIQIGLPYQNKKWIVSGETEFLGYRYSNPMGFALKISKIDTDYHSFYNEQVKRTLTTQM